jgi:hypothetical protein
MLSLFISTAQLGVPLGAAITVPVLLSKLSSSITASMGRNMDKKRYLYLIITRSLVKIVAR